MDGQIPITPPGSNVTANVQPSPLAAQPALGQKPMMQMLPPGLPVPTHAFPANQGFFLPAPQFDPAQLVAGTSNQMHQIPQIPFAHPMYPHMFNHLFYPQLGPVPPVQLQPAPRDVQQALQDAELSNLSQPQLVARCKQLQLTMQGMSVKIVQETQHKQQLAAFAKQKEQDAANAQASQLEVKTELQESVASAHKAEERASHRLVTVRDATMVINELKELIADHKRKKVEADAELATTKAKMEMLRRERDDALDASSVVGGVLSEVEKAEREERDRRLLELEELVREMNEKAEEKEKEHEKVLSRATLERDEWKKTAEERAATILDMQKQLRAMNEKAADIEKEQRKVVQGVTGSMEDWKRIAEENKAKILKKTEELGALQKAFDESVAQATSQLQEREAAIQKIKEENESIKAELAAREAKVGVAEELTQWKEKAEKGVAEIEEMKKELERISSALAASEAKVAVKEDINEWKVKAKKGEATIEELEKELKILQRRLSDRDSEVATLQARPMKMIDVGKMKDKMRVMDGVNRKRSALGGEGPAQGEEGAEGSEEKRGTRSTVKRVRFEMDLPESSGQQSGPSKQQRMSDDVPASPRRELSKRAVGKNLTEKEAATEETCVEKPMKTTTAVSRSKRGIKKDSAATPIGAQTDTLLVVSRAERMQLYKSSEDVFEKFPQLEQNVNIILADFAHSLGKTLGDVITANDNLWKSLAKIKEKLLPKELSACNAHAAQYEDPDALAFSHLVAYLNRSMKITKLDRVKGLFLKVDAIDSSHTSGAHPKVLAVSSSLYLGFDSHKISIEGGLKTALLANAAVSSLFNLQFDHEVSDIARFFYHAAGAELQKVPAAVRKALEIVRD